RVRLRLSGRALAPSQRGAARTIDGAPAADRVREFHPEPRSGREPPTGRPPHRARAGGANRSRARRDAARSDTAAVVHGRGMGADAAVSVLLRFFRRPRRGGPQRTPIRIRRSLRTARQRMARPAGGRDVPLRGARLERARTRAARAPARPRAAAAGSPARRDRPASRRDSRRPRTRASAAGLPHRTMAAGARQQASPHGQSERRNRSETTRPCGGAADLGRLGARTNASMVGVLDDRRRVMPPAVPIATYRLQLSAAFTFDDAARLVPYLKALGISHLYASPFLKARAGSAHGYDIVDHNQINPEFGGDAGFARLSQALADAGIGLILDFVPNHMGVGHADNAWWLDVLEWGQKSPHAAAFDIDWDLLPHRHGGGVLLPILGTPYWHALESGEIVLAYDANEGSFSAW